MVSFHFSCASWKRLAVWLCKVDLGDDNTINETVLLDIDMRVALRLLLLLQGIFVLVMHIYHMAFQLYLDDYDELLITEPMRIKNK